MQTKYWILLLTGLLGLSILGLWVYKNKSFTIYMVGQSIDSFNGIPVYYNGSVRNVSGRSTTADGYNFGLKYHCEEPALLSRMMFY